jgi:hypothetical protein
LMRILRAIVESATDFLATGVANLLHDVVTLPKRRREGVVRVMAGRPRGATCRPLKRRLSGERSPLGQCGRASLLVDLAGDEMALVIEMVVDLGVN